MQSISTKMNYVLSTKILQESDTSSGAVLQKRCSRICGLNPRLIYSQRVSKKLLLKLKFLEDFSGILITTITIRKLARKLA